MQELTKRKTVSGFTIVELLIVIVVIAILAAISIVAYRGIQERARASQASSALAQAKKKLELYKVDASTTPYPTTGNLASAGITDSDVSYQYTSDGSAYCLTATVGSTSYKVTNTSAPESGGCAGHGQGGVPPITNLSLNPKGVGSSGWFNKLGSAMSDTPNVSWGARTDWHRLVRNSSSNNTFRMTVNLSDLINGQAYTASVVVANPGSASYSFSIDFCDLGSVGVTLAPGETRRINTTASRGTYDSVYRFFDLALTTDTADGLLVTDAMITQGSTLYAYADGSTPNWIWNGAANAATSTGPPL